MYKPQRRHGNLEIATEPSHFIPEDAEELECYPTRADFRIKPDTLVTILK